MRLIYWTACAVMLAAMPLHAENLTRGEIVNGADQRIAQYRKGSAQLVLRMPDGQALPAGTALEIEQTRHAFLFGSSTQWLFSLSNQASRFASEPDKARAYSERFAALLNFCTAQIYWSSYERAEGHPMHGLTAENIAWANEHGIRVKCHPLAWNYTPTPVWLRGASPEAVLAAQLARIDRELKRFPGLTWDVVNESAGFDRGTARQRSPEFTRAMEEIGAGNWVRQMYAQARKSDPTAVLLTNDYLTTDDYKHNGIEPLIGPDGTLFDVIGIQSHMHGGVWPPEKTWAVIENFTSYAKPIHFTEVTITSGALDGQRQKQKDPKYDWATTPEGEARQATEVAAFYTLLFSHPSVEAITWWNLTDDRAWQDAPAGLIRADMSPKPAYDALHHLIKEVWWTRAKSNTTAGPVAFEGFHGDYAITATLPGGTALRGVFTLLRGGPGQIEVTLTK